MQIKKLPEALINQIKAGEIVERPMSVIKELVENAIDAKATSICVELLDGGKQLMRVSDNGVGIVRDELGLALERHATSKIRQFSDLAAVRSLGFRGEALPSIASVSHFSLRSRPVEQELGFEIIQKFGVTTQQKDVVMDRGTVIQIKNLFADVPVRLKFLKSTSTEYAHIYEFMQAMSFCYPSISFKLSHNGRDVFHFSQNANNAERFTAIVGSDAKHFVPVQYERGSFFIHGYALQPEHARATASYFVTFVNGRLLQDRVIRAGILQAYQGLLMKGLSPACVLFLRVDPAWVDVNAHPKKLEVRFTDAAVVQDLIATGVADSLKSGISHELASKATAPHKESVLDTRAIAPQIFDENKNEKHLSNNNFYKKDENKNSAIAKLKMVEPLMPRGTIQTGMPNVISASPKEKLEKQDSHLFQTESTKSKEGEIDKLLGHATYLGQYQNCYLLLQVQSSLVVVDQHAFHERILFEDIVAHQGVEKIIKQTLLTPVILPSDERINCFLQQERDIVFSLGFEFEFLTNHNIALHAYPSFLSPQKIHSCFDDILARILSQHNTHLGDSYTHPLYEKAKLLSLQEGLESQALTQKSVYHLYYATLACHSAVRAGDPLSAELALRLLQKAQHVNFYAHCPHGRPVMRFFSEKDVSSWFLRT